MKLGLFPLVGSAKNKFRIPKDKIKLEDSPLLATFDKWIGIRKALSPNLKIKDAYPSLENNIFAKILSSPSRSARTAHTNSRIPRDLLIPFMVKASPTDPTKQLLIPSLLEKDSTNVKYAFGLMEILGRFQHKQAWKRLVPRLSSDHRGTPDVSWLSSTPSVVKEIYKNNVSKDIQDLRFSTEKWFFKRFPEKRKCVVALNFSSEDSKPYRLKSIKDRRVFVLNVALYLETDLLEQLSSAVNSPNEVYLDLVNEGCFELVKHLYLLAVYDR
ncbi:unnamed protein product [Kuraishia capsulata CBS 1993]|uniref:Required for respiratory growth protein 8, mitochondrial n=1 Tax=Kuraishia capsulata CBS 1993 TaxID=1382522 RepID=W6MTN6_9ASCO|nr:uncharacterized protein KUCA_T00004550001 [Kuraishia capsulata CBS 1993]CDK28567.1 unnamed protein product [Kuraishia capsulata CBS 1993]